MCEYVICFYSSVRDHTNNSVNTIVEDPHTNKEDNSYTATEACDFCSEQMRINI